MKAWIVENTRDYDYFDWNEIIFADNYKQAKKLALQTELYETSEDFVHNASKTISRHGQYRKFNSQGI
ncbi:hypothetical protein [Enterococcus cecorum]|uniref:hypothetical protein n=1 Tax=Enterococcus cecorum TaxID=44008 RepID=UPI001FAC12E7|nr:hypothetical protein [Enterococcus cecorum]MCJ0538480.1 hypothetical protein [Enterococcus cecorum]MCJ0546737.1 hypothetical protein [Enterococcus cecorum]MCJ0551538.1 hypothetical protein [Enterococcus cecorum]MCJ0570395.1 hypothetical protein [Enterococcus cecorum]